MLNVYIRKFAKNKYFRSGPRRRAQAPKAPLPSGSASDKDMHVCIAHMHGG